MSELPALRIAYRATPVALIKGVAVVKWILIGFFIMFFASCASTPSTSPAPATRVLFSSYFSLSLPTFILEGGTILGSDGPIISMKNENSLSGLVITRSLDELPDNFDLKKYPLYVLGLAELDNIDSALKSKFRVHIVNCSIQPATDRYV